MYALLILLTAHQSAQILDPMRRHAQFSITSWSQPPTSVVSEEMDLDSISSDHAKPARTLKSIITSMPHAIKFHSSAEPMKNVLDITVLQTSVTLMSSAPMIGKHAKMEFVLIDALNGTVLTVNTASAIMLPHMENAELILIAPNKTAHVLDSSALINAGILSAPVDINAIEDNARRNDQSDLRLHLLCLLLSI